MIFVREDWEVEKIRQSALLAWEVLSSLEPLMVPGTTTKEIDQEAARLIRERGGRPTFLGYRGYPANICVSIDDEVVHGIPGDRKLEEGQLVSVDLGVTYDGYVGDVARTFLVGEVPPEKVALVLETERALWKGIEQAVEGNRVGDISSAIQRHVESCGYSVVRELTGHGVGRELHEDPQVPNFGRPHTGPRLWEGMVLAIEPMVAMGAPDVVIDPDGWTVRTKDGLPSAHFEHTVVVRRGRAEVLSLPEGYA
ncbi:MAG: type I methionyl aminopeptidase [Candidatus Latescibacterota bacterium]|nr:MAG: type I methionyl aminopeptidase [Candidatus Latescibacterota bacterium]RKY71049.1 MAG: type I methionyl aminopeptidase [Candidatus Latescibacterota bacterium]HDI00534.1 type I methionyl aminopeptidase [Bacillota bacterium]